LHVTNTPDIVHPEGIMDTQSVDRRGPGKVRDYLSQEEIRALHVISPWRIVWAGTSVWAVILGMLALAAVYESAWAFALTFAVIGSRQLALSHLVHDACHNNVSRNKARNDWISDIFFAAPTLITTMSYRRQHLPHHSYLGDWERDTDRRAWYNIRGMRFVYRSLWALLGIEAVSTILAYSKVGALSSSPGEQRWRRPILVLGTQGLIFAYCFWLGMPLGYFTLWILPLFTVMMYLLTLRVIAEHQTEAYALADEQAFRRTVDEPLIRTLQPGLLGRFWLGSMNFFYHHEHHLLPGVPYTCLPKLHRALRERGYYNTYSEALGDGYWRTLTRLVVPHAPSPAGVREEAPAEGRG
jgi:fatty acid desaturase